MITQADFVENTDYLKLAAAHLRAKSSEQGLRIGSSHAHSLVAASLGYRGKVSLNASSAKHDANDPWLHTAKPDLQMLEDVIDNMRKGDVRPKHLEFIAKTIQDGLTPPCVETGQHSTENIPLGCVEYGDHEAHEWVHPSVALDTEIFGHCRCCGYQTLYRLTALDSQGLCAEHRGEFDFFGPEEKQDWHDRFDHLVKNR